MCGACGGSPASRRARYPSIVVDRSPGPSVQVAQALSVRDPDREPAHVHPGKNHAQDELRQPARWEHVHEHHLRLGDAPGRELCSNGGPPKPSETTGTAQAATAAAPAATGSHPGRMRLTSGSNSGKSR